MIDIMNYAKALSGISDNKYIGSYIGKIKFQKLNDKKPENITYQAKELKCNKLLSIIEIYCLCDEKPLEKMTVTIALPRTDKGISNKYQVNNSIPINKDNFITFSKKDIVNFSDIVGDNNPIHLKESAVVQGMLLLKELINRYAISQDFEIKFLNPVYQMNQIYLYETIEMSKKIIEGISSNIKCFKVYRGGIKKWKTVKQV